MSSLKKLEGLLARVGKSAVKESFFEKERKSFEAIETQNTKMVELHTPSNEILHQRFTI